MLNYDRIFFLIPTSLSVFLSRKQNGVFIRELINLLSLNYVAGFIVPIDQVVGTVIGRVHHLDLFPIVPFCCHHYKQAQKKARIG